MVGVDLDLLGAEIDRLTFGAGALEETSTSAASIEPPAVRRILVAVDATDAARIPLLWAARLAKLYGASVTVAHVLPPPTYLTLYQGVLPDLPQDVTGVLEERGERVLRAALETLASHGVEATTSLLRGSPVREITHLAESESHDLVVVGSHDRRGLERLMLGSVADGVKNHVHASVLIAKEEPPTDAPLLVPVDGSRGSKRAAAFAVDLARRMERRATVLHVLPDLLNDLPADAPRRLADVNADLTRVSPLLDCRLAQGDVVHEVLRVKRGGGYGLLIMGTRGLGGLRSAVLGSVSGSLSHQARISVLIVKGPR